MVWAARQEMARTVDAVLSRRTRALFLDARAATRMVPLVAQILARELNRDDAWVRAQIEAATALAAQYLAPAHSDNTQSIPIPTGEDHA